MLVVLLALVAPPWAWGFGWAELLELEVIDGWERLGECEGWKRRDAWLIFFFFLVVKEEGGGGLKEDSHYEEKEEGGTRA